MATAEEILKKTENRKKQAAEFKPKTRRAWDFVFEKNEQTQDSILGYRNKIGTKWEQYRNKMGTIQEQSGNNTGTIQEQSGNIYRNKYRNKTDNKNTFTHTEKKNTI